MPIQLSNTAISNVVYYYGRVVGTSTVIRIADNVRVVDTVAQLLAIPDPKEDDIVIVKNGTEPFILAVFTSQGWVYKSLEGDKGEKGDKGDVGGVGEKGDKGDTGSTGQKGDKGDAPQHEWRGTAVRFRNPNGLWGNLIQLKGDRGDSGANGKDGVDGKAPEHEWIGDSLHFRTPTGVWGELRDLKGIKGDTGEKGEKGEKGDRGFKGNDGRDGKDGLSPRIVNNTWWIGDTDTGVSAITGYVHLQPEAFSVWVVAHNLSSFPNVTVVDAMMEKLEGDVIYLDNKTISISFSRPYSGMAFCT